MSKVDKEDALNGDSVPKNEKETSKDVKEKKEKKEKKDKKEKKEKKDKKDKEHKEHKHKEHKHKEHKHKEHKHKEHKKEEKDKETAMDVDAEVKPAPTESGIKSTAPSAAVEEFLKTNAVTIDVAPGITERSPVLKMKDVQVNPKIAKVIQQFETPTPIQSTTWPYLLDGRDVVGVAETGSGKTLAFGVPIIDRLANNKTVNSSGINCLVVSPTRELAMQIHDAFEGVLRETRIKSLCLYGGVPKYEQQSKLRDSSVRVVVGTPGRLRDLLADGSLVLKNCEYLVLDEADRMLETGFEQDITEILSCAPNPTNRQTVMFTATWPPEVRSLAAGFMKPEVVKISIGEVDELHANKRITQIVEVIDQRQKERKLMDLLAKYAKGNEKVLIFALYKKEASRIERLLNQRGYKVAAVHGDLNQGQRTQALQDFKTGKTSLMLATDVAARGLDIPAVKTVINLTFPLTVEDYVHRIGRTGRAGQSGTAHTLFTEQEKHLAGALMNVLRDADQPVPEDLMKFGSHTKKKEHSLYGAFYKNVDTTKKAKKVKFD